MENGLIDTAAQGTKPDDRRIYGTAVAEVIENCDQAIMGRVRVRLPWLPGYEPWARVAVAMAGDDCGAYVMPQVGDQVLVVFNHGDVREPFVIGSLWNGKNRPPVKAPTDAETVWVVRTPKGQEIILDDADRSIRIRTSGKRRVTLTDQKVEISVDDGNSTAIALDSNGDISVKAQGTLTLEGASIQIKGTQTVAISKPNTLTIEADSLCKVEAKSILIG